MAQEEDTLNLSEMAIEQIAKMMEEMAGAPREELGKRVPGEKCMSEIYNYEQYKKNLTSK